MSGAVPYGTLTRSWDTSAASTAAKLRREHGIRTSPYLARPSRETFTEYEEWSAADGTPVLRRHRSVSRWNDIYSYGEWVTE